MSRIGKLPIEVPQAVKVAVDGQNVSVSGPKGSLSRCVRDEVQVIYADGKITVSRRSEDRAARAFHGLERSLVNNMVAGVSTGFSKELEVIGVGYRAEIKDNVLNLELGFSHPVDHPLPAGVSAQVIKDGRQIFIRIEGPDKQRVGQVAAEVRSYRPPEPYKGKGIRYRDEDVRIKAGKSGKK